MEGLAVFADQCGVRVLRGIDRTYSILQGMGQSPSEGKARPLPIKWAVDLASDNARERVVHVIQNGGASDAGPTGQGHETERPGSRHRDFVLNEVDLALATEERQASSRVATVTGRANIDRLCNVGGRRPSIVDEFHGSYTCADRACQILGLGGWIMTEVIGQEFTAPHEREP